MIPGLALFRKTNGRCLWNVASFHSPHSLTWSWILSFSLPRRGEGRWLHFSAWMTPAGRNWVLQVGRCALRLHRQRPIYFRELYYRVRDERDGLRERVAKPRPPLRSPFVPTVIDGDQSLH